mgnify:CR=1 FL=1
MKKILNYVPAVLSAILAIGVVTAFKACAPMEDGSWMNCHNAQMQVFVTAIVITIIAVVNIFLNNKKINLCLGIVGVILAVLAAIVPGIITHLCMMNTMRCHTIMRPYVVVLSVLFIIAQVLLIVFGLKDMKKEQ